MEYMGLACPPMDFGFLTATDSIPAVAAHHHQPLDDFSSFFDDLDDNGDVLIKGSQHQPPAVAVEKKTPVISKPRVYGKGKDFKLLLTLKKPPTYGKGKEMKLLLASRDETKPIITNTNKVASTDPAPSMFKKRAAPAVADHRPSKVSKVAVVDEHKSEQAKKKVMGTTETAVTKPIITNTRVPTADPPSLPKTGAEVPKTVAEDDHEHKIEVTIQNVIHKYEEAAEAKRKRQAVLIDYVPPKPKPSSNSCRFKSKKLQRLYAAHKIFH